MGKNRRSAAEKATAKRRVQAAKELYPDDKEAQKKYVRDIKRRHMYALIADIKAGKPITQSQQRQVDLFVRKKEEKDQRIKAWLAKKNAT